MKRLIAMALVALTAIEFVSAEPTVTDVTAKQRYPWNGLVDISCRVSGIEADAGEYEFVVVAVDKEAGKEYTASDFSIEHGGTDVTGFDVSEDGTYNLLWNAREDLGQVISERMTVRITLAAVWVSVGKVQLWEGGPYWADRNIGASKPWKYGLYFWWGDTTGHRPSSDGKFGFGFYRSTSSCPTLGKDYSTLQSEGWIVSKDGSYVLAPAHDAAHVKWGGSWRMPTYQELYDLNTKCDWTWTTLNGVNGCIVRGRGTYASNSIFLPAAGDAVGFRLSLSGTNSYYWSAVPYSDDNSTWFLLFNGLSYHTTRYSFARYLGHSIRPVQ